MCAFRSELAGAWLGGAGESPCRDERVRCCVVRRFNHLGVISLQIASCASHPCLVICNSFFFFPIFLIPQLNPIASKRWLSGKEQEQEA